MFDRFRSHFRLVPEGQKPSSPWIDDRARAVTGYEELVTSLAGCSFEGGLYRLHSSVSGSVGQADAEEAFPEHVGRLFVFGFDWLGRQFAVDFRRVEEDEPLVMMLEPGSGEALEIPANFVTFHDQELVDFREEALASGFFAAWVEANPKAAPLDLSRCVGYRVPLFLGGKDTVDNLEVVDFDVYWTLSGQMRLQAGGSSPGTNIGGVSIDE